MTSDGLVVTVTERDSLVVVHAAGDVDYPNQSLMQDRLDEALASRPPRVVVNLRDTRFIDSSGLALLVIAFRRVAAYGGWLRIAEPGRQFRRVLRTTNLERWLTPYPTVEAAAAGEAGDGTGSHDGS